MKASGVSRVRGPKGARLCFAGADLSLTTDLTAQAFVYCPTESDPVYRIVERYYLPEERAAALERVDRQPYRVWASEGWLTLTSGDVVDYGYLKADVLEVAERARLVKVGMDPYNATDFALDLEASGVGTEFIGMGYSTMNPALRATERAILEGKVRHVGNPVTRWMLGNVRVQENAVGHIRPVKNSGGRGTSLKKRYKIDGWIAIAIGVWMAVGEGPQAGKRQGSVYAERGVRAV